MFAADADPRDDLTGVAGCALMSHRTATPSPHAAQAFSLARRAAFTSGTQGVAPCRLLRTGAASDTTAPFFAQSVLSSRRLATFHTRARPSSPPVMMRTLSESQRVHGTSVCCNINKNFLSQTTLGQPTLYLKVTFPLQFNF